MRVNGIRFEEDRPDQVTLSLTIEEAAHVVRFLGKVIPRDVEPQASWPSCSALYDLLTGMVFNAYWEDGVDDFFRGAS